MRVKTVLASEIARLDSDVRRGGGTDDTAALQAVLDEAKDEAVGIRLIMDGAALVSGLQVYSDTTIECLNRDCGFFQIDRSNRAIVTNGNWRDGWDNKTILDRNISLIGGTYNQNCLHQEHNAPYDGYIFMDSGENTRWVYALEFYGVENLTMRDMAVVDFRTFAVTVGCFRNVTIEDVWLDLPNRMYAQNQDGFHFWGPGQFLTVRNVGGKVGDDFMNLGPDEADGVSDITDVLVDGVFLDDADQAIRLLSRDKGRLDRVTLRNITGVYRSYGFYINPWYPKPTYGNFGHIFIENVDLKAVAPNYDYRPPMLFSIGANIDCLTLKNIRLHDQYDNRTAFEFGLPNYATDPDNIDTYQYPTAARPRMRNILIEGLTVMANEGMRDSRYIAVYGAVERMIVRHADIFQAQPGDENGSLVCVHPTGSVGQLVMNDINTVGLAAVIEGRERIEKMQGDVCYDE